MSEKYRPQRLSDVLGQSYAVQALQDFADAPYPQAFLFHGPPGTGKTSSALALARELGVNFDWNLLQIKSGELNDEAVGTAFRMLRQVGLADGWKLVICDEGDLMSPKARGLWLSLLEEIPRKSVIVFTTNNLDKFEQRFIERCEQIKFESRYRDLKHEAQSYLARIWNGEGMPGPVPDIDETNVQIEGVLSFRRIARFVEQAKHRGVARKPARTAGISLKDHETYKQTVRL